MSRTVQLWRLKSQPLSFKPSTWLHVTIAPPLGLPVAE